MRTLKGARAQYHRNELAAETELSMGEWLDFIRALYKCGIDKLESKPGQNKPHGKDWGISIYSSGKDKPDKFSQYNSYLPNYDELKKVMAAMEKKIRSNPEVRALETKLGAEHKRIYGIPITEMERSVRNVRFAVWGDEIKDRINIIVTRTATGATVKEWWGDVLKAELDTEEWLSFIKDVFECRFDEWQHVNYGSRDTVRFHWRIRASFTDRNELENDGDSADPPRCWDKLKKYQTRWTPK
jgi:hypothetical protein